MPDEVHTSSYQSLYERLLCDMVVGDRGSRSHLLLARPVRSQCKSRPVVPAPFTVSVLTHTLLSRCLRNFVAPKKILVRLTGSNLRPIHGTVARER